MVNVGKNTMKATAIERLTYWQIWGIKRKAGYIGTSLPIAGYAFVFLIFLRVCYAFYTFDLKITTMDALVLVFPAMILASLIWLIHEVIYHLKTSK